jgi:hypothetical protein
MHLMPIAPVFFFFLTTRRCPLILPWWGQTITRRQNYYCSAHRLSISEPMLVFKYLCKKHSWIPQVVNNIEVGELLWPSSIPPWSPEEVESPKAKTWQFVAAPPHSPTTFCWQLTCHGCNRGLPHDSWCLILYSINTSPQFATDS